jgi:hypothetical protein
VIDERYLRLKREREKNHQQRRPGVLESRTAWRA